MGTRGRLLAAAAALMGIAGAWTPAHAADTVSTACATAGGCWATMDTPSPTSASRFSDVSCPAVSFCVAVGTREGSYPEPTLAEQWDGTSWSVMATVDPNLPSGLSGVSCTSATFCVAVGTTYASFHHQPLAEEWNGASWTVMTTPYPSGLDAHLSGVSCTSATFCMAVGDDNGSPLIEQWDGSAWAAITPAQPPDSSGTFAILSSASCTSGSFCIAAGEYQVAGGDKPLAERWNGLSWSVLSAANPGSGANNGFSGVSCAALDACIAVGGYNDGTAEQTLAEQWNGSAWTTVTTPSPGSSAWLQRVSCPSSTSCIAVGSDNLYEAGGLVDENQTVAEKWNGSSWSQMVTQNPSSNASLQGVSCPSASECIAAGSSPGTLAESWKPALSGL